MCMVGLFAPFPIFVLALVCYVMRWNGLELLLLGMYIDVQFGQLGTEVPCMYTLTIAGTLISAELIKPYVRFYETRV